MIPGCPDNGCRGQGGQCRPIRGQRDNSYDPPCHSNELTHINGCGLNHNICVCCVPAKGAESSGVFYNWWNLVPYMFKQFFGFTRYNIIYWSILTGFYCQRGLFLWWINSSDDNQKWIVKWYTTASIKGIKPQSTTIHNSIFCSVALSKSGSERKSYITHEACVLLNVQSGYIYCETIWFRNSFFFNIIRYQVHCDDYNMMRFCSVNS